MAIIAALGSGIMATALSFPTSENGNDVRLVGTFLDREIIDSIQRTGVHPDLGLKVNDGVRAYQLEDAAEAIADADVVMCGVNSFGVEWAGEQLAGLMRPGQKLLCVTKGMRADEDGTMRILPDVLRSYFDPRLAEQVSWNAVVGPSIAGEVAVHHDTCVVFCGQDKQDLEYIAELFRTDYYHVWTSTDFIGHETGAATKNIYAFAAGFAQGLLRKAGKQDDRYVMYNYGAAVFAQGQKELRSFIKLMGGNPETGDGLGGVGDMFVTSMGGRNVKAGGFVGEGIPFSQVQEERMKDVTLEGVAAIKVIGKALEPLTERGVIGADEYPLCRFLYSVVAKDAPLGMPWDQFFRDLK
ncbi:NAD(P)H-dependent glycerol-3-phosphate dehydrogenase [Propionibacterium australiense]|uniref:Glycerol-3-phosphate dehydrogenase n=1 Tax=Propionibacterium australiense TaxID=119981 RepID=A0A383S530_9ACTN|nr:glycerol-3-phosphate dehydrogenase [Propionibacterium australiense]RLP08873.1 glycerol-3-phosphate dehydrogenase [Propionibacterium australiense]RLP11751.1 glycerol-3-phosphate dehydrogenase [Propionibacterium australiense]SYZ32504.1 NAD-dependent glycerol-3-phosphate dehydrogenase signature [Propionibacterium australiense]VEH90091.1 Glycerol-3-phosphate dehydrogenase [NAD(P)+] [Propionibacterium australiense]